MTTEATFFGPLKRREKYETKTGGDFYVYSHYRAAIAEDCECRCAYCDSHEDALGGREAMELDHFRPWQKKFGPFEEKKFEHLKNVPHNLVHACGVCNGFKLDFWPTEDPARAYDHEKGWIEPFDECRANFLEVQTDGTLCARKSPGQYQITKLRLNRPLLKRMREHYILKQQLEVWIKTHEPKWQDIARLQPGTPNAQTATEVLQLLAMIRQLLC